MTSYIEVVGFHGCMRDGETPSLHEPVLARRDGDDWCVVTPDDLDSTDVPCSFEPRNWMNGTRVPHEPYQVDWIILVLGGDDWRVLGGLRTDAWQEHIIALVAERDRVANYGPRKLMGELRDLLARNVRERLIALAWRDLALSAEAPTQALLEAYAAIKPGVLVLPKKVL